MLNLGAFLQARHLELDRRRFLAGAAAFAGAAMLPKGAFAQAAPHTFQQGDFEVTVISDGHLVLTSDIFAPDAPPEERKALLDALGIGDELNFPANAPMIRAGSDLILIDNGSGSDFQPTAGKLAENIAAAGIDPASITKVVFTHAHPDHIWGTVGADGLRHPNATYYVSSAEWDFWTNPDLKTQMPAEMHVFVGGAVRHLTAVKDRVTMVKPGDEIVTGVSVLDTAGHTPGHISIEIAGGEGLIVTGDVIPSPGIFLPHPDWTFGFDADAALSAKNRAALLDRVATDKMKMLGFHWEYPGVGFAERKDNAYEYAPAA